MKTKKAQVYDLLCSHYIEGQCQGATTQLIATALGIQRSNVSALLNELVKEGTVQKTVGRPVLYCAKAQNHMAESSFENLIGYDGSLKHVVQLAKAAVLYPQGSLNTLILGMCGTVKKLLALVMYQYAVKMQVLEPKAPYKLVDCQQYSPDGVINEFFGLGKAYEAARSGILVLTNVHILHAQPLSLLLEKLEEQQSQSAEGRPPMVLVLANRDNRSFEALRNKLPIVIEIPSLKERPLEERFSIIQNLFALEAAHTHRTISLNAEVMRCLLLYETELNIFSLKYDIKTGCASAYVREHSIQSNTMNLYMGDFENYVRKGFLNY